MKDIILQLAAKQVNDDPAVQTSVTLVVGGFLVSGSLCCVGDFYEHHPLTKLIQSTVDKTAATDESTSEPTLDDLPNYIHLKDAKYFTPSGNPIPGNQGIYVRIDLESVDGFSFGRLEVEVK